MLKIDNAAAKFGHANTKLTPSRTAGIKRGLGWIGEWGLGGSWSRRGSGGVRWGQSVVGRSCRMGERGLTG